MKSIKHWQDPTSVAIGAWFVASPWVLGFQEHQAAMISSLAAGLLLVAVALGATLAPRAWVGSGVGPPTTGPSCG